MDGRYLVNFKDPEPWHKNDMLPASVEQYDRGRVYVEWDNGQSCVIKPIRLNFAALPMEAAKAGDKHND